MTIARAFAVGKFEVTFAEWDACVAGGGCAGNKSPSDQGWGRGRRPVVNVSIVDAREFASYLSRKTGKSYRLLSEAEWEYAARAGTTTDYPWGDAIGRGNASCDGCGSQWDNKQTAPVGSFKPNAFGLFDMHGNAGEWVQDGWHPDYDNAPTDGSVWSSGAVPTPVQRGGAWFDVPFGLRSSSRYTFSAGFSNRTVGFRVARTLDP